jgi:hypothetical protein
MNDISALRAHLFAAIEGIKNKTLSIEEAKTISDISQTVINSAKVEVEYIRATGATDAVSSFLPALEAPNTEQTSTGTITRLPGKTVHRMRG